jgi:hypothetical protein
MRQSQTTLHFGSEEFPILPTLFAQTSIRYASLLKNDSPPPSITVKRASNRDSVLLFISSCHNRPVVLDNDNVNDSFVLAIDWDVPTLVSDITVFVSSPQNLHCTLIPLLLHAYACDCNTSSLTNLCVANFSGLHDDFLHLPLPLLARVTNSAISVFPAHVIFPFLFECLTLFGARASVLFSVLEFAQLETEQLESLIESETFVWAFAGRSLADAAFSGRPKQRPAPVLRMASPVNSRVGQVRAPPRRTSSFPGAAVGVTDSARSLAGSVSSIGKFLKDARDQQDRAVANNMRKLTELEAQTGIFAGNASAGVEKCAAELVGWNAAMCEQESQRSLIEQEVAELEEMINEVADESDPIEEIRRIRNEAAELVAEIEGIDGNGVG